MYSDENIIPFFVPFLNPFFFVYCGAKFVLRKVLTFGAVRVTIKTKNSLDAVVSPYRGSLFLTTVYPTTASGVDGNSGDKSAGKDVFLSGKRRKGAERSGERQPASVWERKSLYGIISNRNNRKFPETMRFRLVLRLFEPISKLSPITDCSLHFTTRKDQIAFNTLFYQSSQLFPKCTFIVCANSSHGNSHSSLPLTFLVCGILLTSRLIFLVCKIPSFMYS